MSAIQQAGMPALLRFRLLELCAPHSSLFRSVPSSTRRFNAHAVARLEFQSHFAGQLLLATTAHQGVAATRARAASLKAIRWVAATVGQDGGRRRRQHFVFTNETLAAGESTCTAAA